jgi:hypothetical protein
VGNPSNIDKIAPAAHLIGSIIEGALSRPGSFDLDRDGDANDPKKELAEDTPGKQRCRPEVQGNTARRG